MNAMEELVTTIQTSFTVSSSLYYTMALAVQLGIASLQTSLSLGNIRCTTDLILL
jgi:hypothetical protein